MGKARQGPEPGEDYMVYFVREYVIPGIVFFFLVRYLWRNVIKPSAEIKIWEQLSFDNKESNVEELEQESNELEIPEEVKKME